jgi:hypothetical protein
LTGYFIDQSRIADAPANATRIGPVAAPATFPLEQLTKLDLSF